MSFWDFVWKNWIMFCKTHLGDVILGFCLEEFANKHLGDVILGFCLEELDPVLQKFGRIGSCFAKKLRGCHIGILFGRIADPVLRKKHLGDVILGVCLEEVDPVLRKNHLGVSSWDFVWKNPPCFTKTFWGYHLGILFGRIPSNSVPSSNPNPCST